MTDSLILLFLGILISYIGFRMYNYYEKYFEENDERSKNFARSVLVILMGFSLIVFAVITYFTTKK